MVEQTLVLDNHKAQQKIIRIAHQIAEFNYDENSIILVGIGENGYRLTELIHQTLARLITCPIHKAVLLFDKKDPVHSDYELKTDIRDLSNQVVILIDDVLQSGKTLIYGAKYLLNYPLKKLSTAVLVDRMHPSYPVKADFVGLTLSTTMQQHITVEFSDTDCTVVLD